MFKENINNNDIKMKKWKKLDIKKYCALNKFTVMAEVPSI